MASPPLQPARLIAGRLALDFANLTPNARDLSWGEFVAFLVVAKVTGEERARHLRPLAENEPQAVDGVLLKTLRLRESLRAIFAATCEKRSFPRIWAEPINEILRITEGHDELTLVDGVWRLQFLAREESLDWLLAAIARSGAELLAEGLESPIRRCANPACRLFFYDDSRTHRRRWCSMSVCGNRHKVASFLHRKSAHHREN
jgi:predicted RNA-binding Zn ribbon-like protein